MDLKYEKVLIELTSHCNFNCDFCVNAIMQRKRGFIDPDIFKRIIDELATKGMTPLVFFHIMGEPLLHPNAYELLEYAARRIRRTLLITNGSLLTGANVGKCFETGITNLDISYHMSNEDDFNLRRAKNLSFEAYKRGIQEVVKTKFVNDYKTHLRLYYPNINLSSHRWDCSARQQVAFHDLSQIKSDIYEWILFVEKLRQDFELRIDINRNLEAIDKMNIQAEFTYSITDGFTLIIKPFHNYVNAQSNVKKALIGKCIVAVLHREIDILHNGDVVLCCYDYDGETKVGNVRDRSLTNVLSGERYQRVIRDFSKGIIPFEKCKTCLGANNYKDWLIKQMGTYMANLRIVRFFIDRLGMKKIGPKLLSGR